MIEITTLVDITNTGVVRLNQGTQLELDQNRNFVTLKQCAEIRSIIIFEDSPQSEVVDVKGHGFGTAYKGKHRVWTFRFSPDRDGVYDDERGNTIGELINDIDGVPFIKKLEETVNIDKAVFDCIDPSTKNTTIKALSGTA